MKLARTEPLGRWFRLLTDLPATLILWFYFTIGFVICFSPWYLGAFLFARNRERSIQSLNHYFYRGFFGLLRILVPRTRWCIDESVRAVRSAIVVCNHVSYLDSILMISLFRQHRTIVKNRFFSVPFLSQVVRGAGYIPSQSKGRFADMVIHHLENMDTYLTSGENLFIFPEGTRSRNGAIGTFNPGAFKLARLCRKPVVVLIIRNTDKLFQPGRFLFNTCTENTITVKMVGILEPEKGSKGYSVPDLMNRVRALMEKDLLELPK